MSIDHLTAGQISGMNARQLNALIKRAYEDAAVLLEEIDRSATGSGVVIDVSGSDLWPRIVGSTEAFGHLANHPHHFTVSTTGDRRARLDAVVAGWRGRVVGQACACERRTDAVGNVAATLRSRLDAAGLNPEVMYSDGAAASTDVVASKLVDLAIEQVDGLFGGRLDNLTRVALAMVPADIFTA